MGAPRSYSADSEISRGESAGDHRPILIASGWAAITATLEDGRRQIISLLIAGDILEPLLDLQPGLAVTALTTVVTVDSSGLVSTLRERLAGDLRPLAEAWARMRQAVQARLLRQVVRLGRLSAYERTAELMVDLHRRQRRSGLADEQSMPLPLTQEMLADHLGLSVVHVNRILQQLRREGLIVFRAGRIVLPDLPRLTQATRR
ncbi:Crp/Fnr family transcriptional regulator [Phenylobacterium sp.]|uniref:Crp/Fnr family transcriptional regulator n=1 Tax=Phenylobacterium sp. TaxID=1871053 RepID=UPI002F3FA0E3